MGYYYDMHCHTAEGSACSDFPVREMVKFYKDHGYDGFTLADHFSGNSTFPGDMPWKERVDAFYGIYETACEEAYKLGGIQVFFGMEYTLRKRADDMRYALGNDFVIVNLTKEWILENEDAFSLDFNKNFDTIRAAGGFIIHAHPFLEAPWVRSIQLLPRKVDAIEIINGGLDDITNDSAKWYADRYTLPYCAGTDIHHSTHPVLCGIETEEKCSGIADVINAIKDRKAKVFKRPASEMLIK